MKAGGHAATFGRERLYDFNLADGRTLRYVCESDLEIIPPVSPPDPAPDQAIEAGLNVLPVRWLRLSEQNFQRISGAPAGFRPPRSAEAG